MHRRFLSRWDFAVLETEHKGKGLFAQHDIPEGAYLFDYEGETLDLPAYESRYPDKVSDYAVGIKMPNGALQFKDAADPHKSGLARFMNHDFRSANVRRTTALGGHLRRRHRLHRLHRLHRSFAGETLHQVRRPRWAAGAHVREQADQGGR
jgi:hypothetical protein